MLYAKSKIYKNICIFQKNVVPLHSKSEIRVIYNIPENTLNEDEIILSEYSYDNTGRLVQNLLCNKQDTIHYSYDMRNMLTETRNRHFTERLFYADSLPLYAYPFNSIWQLNLEYAPNI